MTQTDPPPKKPIIRKNFAITVILVILQILVLVLASKATWWTIVDGTNFKLYDVALINGDQRAVQGAIYASFWQFFALIPLCSPWIWILFFRHVSKRISHLFALPWGEFILILVFVFFTLLLITSSLPRFVYTYIPDGFPFGFALSIVALVFIIYGVLYRRIPKKEPLCLCINILGWLIFILIFIMVLWGLVVATGRMLGIWW